MMVCKHSCTAPSSNGNIYQRTVISTSYGNHTFIRTSPQSTRTETFVLQVHYLVDCRSTRVRLQEPAQGSPR